MSERAIRELAELIQRAHEATGGTREAALADIGRLIMREAEFEPIVIHNTDGWKEERIEVRS